MFYLTKAKVPHMKRGSAIINTASINFDMPNPILLAYATPKVAIQNFTAASSSFSPRWAFAPTPWRRGRFGRR
jgi:NAD(P)-dependent dehydrogenase (short-subunit alcohol dehydrogenase family)